MSQYGPVLSGRDAGREAGLQLRSALRESNGVLLSFEDVEVASPSFLDEIIKAARAELSGGSLLLITHLGTEDVLDALTLVLNNNKMTLARLEEDHKTVNLLGGAAHLRETLDAARELGEFRVPDLAERLKLKMPAMHQRLQALLDAGAVTRVPSPTPTRGGSHVYSAPQAEDIQKLEDLQEA
jgi:DNA-binding MarR family transcriptional regulator